ncbi:Pkinase-domain-containing protein [Testicularia cyperi]|uniref:non-specific serine/threonine protein kinase n=1 Tax=Testicularia cyperi TaxID=1882483 RepID=A0A317XMM6_9BASI|nr:Pkinase-domain-containing protein [Testicularia cyperi]
MSGKEFIDSPLAIDSTFNQSAAFPQRAPSRTAPTSSTPMSAPTPLLYSMTLDSGTSSAAVSRGSSIRSVAPPASSASTTRIRKGLLSRAGSGAEDRVQRNLSLASQQLMSANTDEDEQDEEEPIISDSGPMPRRFAPLSTRGATSQVAPGGARQPSQQRVLSPTYWQASGSSSSSSLSTDTSASGNSISSRQSAGSSGNRSGSGEASDGAASVGGVSLGRAMSVSSVSSVTSTSSLEAAPFREAPMGNVRLGFGAMAAGFRGAAGRPPRNSQFGASAVPMQPSRQPPYPPHLQQQSQQQSQPALPTSNPELQQARHPSDHPPSAAAGGNYGTSGSPQAIANGALAPTPSGPSQLSSSAPSDRYRGVPKQASDAWMYRVGPGMRTGRPRGSAPSPAPSSSSASLSSESPVPSQAADEQLLQSAATPSKRSRDALRQKFAKGAGRLGIKTSITTSTGGMSMPSDHLAAYNPHDSSEDEDSPLQIAANNRTPLPRNSSYFSAAPHSAGPWTDAPPHPSLTPMPSDFRTSSVTNAPLIVSKAPEGPAPSQLRPPDAVNAASDPMTVSMEQDRSTGGSALAVRQDQLVELYSKPANQTRRRSAATQRPSLLRAESSENSMGYLASPGLKVDDPIAISASPARSSLYTLSSTPKTNTAGDGAVSSTPVSTSSALSRPTPAEIVRMEAQAGIASLPDSPSEPSPVPSNYSPSEPAISAVLPTGAITGAALDEGFGARQFRESNRFRRASNSGSDASSATGRGTSSAPQRRPDSLTRQRLWSSASRPGLLRSRTSENATGRARSVGGVGGGSDRGTSSSAPQSPEDAETSSLPFGRSSLHSKSNSGSTVPAVSVSGGDDASRVSPHVSIIHEDEVMPSTPLSAPGHGTTPLMDVEVRALSPSSARSVVPASSTTATSSALFSVATIQPRANSPASQLARSPETIRGGPVRIADSIYGRSPASIANLRSPLLQPTLASSPWERPSERPTTPLSAQTAATTAANASASTSTSPSPSARGPNDFHFGDTLGEGSYSTVLEAWDLLSGPNPKEPSVVDPNATSAAAAMVGSSSRRKRRRVDLTGRKAYAIKVLDKVHILKQGKQKYVSVEKEALSRLIRHPGVVTLFWTFQDRESLYFVLELANNGELLGFIRQLGSFDRRCATFYAAQLADAIDAMHRAGVVHRDIKPENILLDSQFRIKVTDFGSAKIAHAPNAADEPRPAATQAGARGDIAAPSSGRAASFVGTAEYVSPELLVERAQPAGKPADWWAFGCVLFQMLAGRPPFKGVNEYQTLQKVKHRDFYFPEGFPSDAQNLVDRLLVLEPSERLTATEIKAHPFFDSIDFSQLWHMDVPKMQTGLVPPAPRPQAPHEVAETSDFSFEEGFESSADSQAYAGDTQSIDNSLDTSRGERDADNDNDSDDSDVSLEMRRRGSHHADHFQSPGHISYDSSNGDDEARRLAARHQASQTRDDLRTSAATMSPRRRFSALSTDAGRLVSSKPNGTAPPASGEGFVGDASRATRPFPRSKALAPASGSFSPGPPQRSTADSTAKTGLQAASIGLTGWSALLLPKEVMLYTLPVQQRTGTGKMFTKRRQLVLTDFPRLLCVKETAAALKVKSEVILTFGSSNRRTGPSAGAAAFDAAGSAGRREDDGGDGALGGAGFEKISSGNVNASNPNLLISVDWRAGKSFTVRTSAQKYVYETLSGDAFGIVKAIRDAARIESGPL